MVSFSKGILILGELLFVIGSIVSQGTHDLMTSSNTNIQEIVVPMCSKFLPYNLTKLPNQYGHRTQLKIYKRLERLWSYMDSGCSANLRLLACSLYLPRYDATTGQTFGPCKSTCKIAKRKCKPQMDRWPRQFRCKRMSRDTRTCIAPYPETRFQPDHAYCVPNPAPFCGTLSYIMGTLPNIFFQVSVNEIQAELQHYDRLVASGCSPHTAFFLCGTLMPYCIHEQHRPFSMPCREICDQVHQDCSATYSSLYRGLPWPTKLQCYRFPSVNDNGSGNDCVMS